jgi:hypothetical protein
MEAEELLAGVLHHQELPVGLKMVVGLEGPERNWVEMEETEEQA